MSRTAGAAVAVSEDLAAGWKKSSIAFAHAVRAGVGFSLLYRGQPVGPSLSADWVPGESGPRESASTFAVKHASGLRVARSIEAFSGFSAMEYQVGLRNETEHSLEPVSKFHFLNLALSASVDEDISVLSCTGGRSNECVPAKGFSLRRHRFSNVVGSWVDFGTEGGRSSDGDLPFFIIHNATHNEGMIIAIGWSGQWQAMIARHLPPGSLEIKACIPDIDISLRSREEIQGPTCLVAFYAGDIEAGTNHLRRLIREKYTPKLKGKSMAAVATYDTWLGVADNFDEKRLTAIADRAAEIGQEFFLLDDGWFEGEMWSSVGNWERVHTTRLPRGLAPVAEYIRSKGLQFGLWFEPERVAEGSMLAQEHPDWIRWDYGKAAYPPWYNNDVWLSYLDIGSLEAAFGASGVANRLQRRYGLLDYGNEQVQRYVLDLLHRYIVEYDIKYIRYDFNIDPLPYWQAADAPHRRGIAQLTHIHGFYSVLDWLRERHPDVILEGCAAGGRRIDLEVVRRFHTLWISDTTFDPYVVRFHLQGINHFLPGNYHYVQYALPSVLQESFEPEDVWFQCMFGGAMGMGGCLDQWSVDHRNKARQHVSVHKKLRRYLVEDFYLLGGQGQDPEQWSAWQFHDPRDDSGFIQTFRGKTQQAARSFPMRALDEGEPYLFTDVYDGTSFEMRGRDATVTGIETSQAERTSKIFLYRRLSAKTDGGMDAVGS